MLRTKKIPYSAVEFEVDEENRIEREEKVCNAVSYFPSKSYASI